MWKYNRKTWRARIGILIVLNDFCFWQFICARLLSPAFLLSTKLGQLTAWGSRLKNATRNTYSSCAHGTSARVSRAVRARFCPYSFYLPLLLLVLAPRHFEQHKKHRRDRSWRRIHVRDFILFASRDRGEEFWCPAATAIGPLPPDTVSYLVKVFCSLTRWKRTSNDALSAFRSL